MARRLFPTVPLEASESPQSFVSRLAHIHAIPSARRFCTDMGFSFQHVVDGDALTLAGIADLSGADPEALQSNALVKDADGWTLRGQRLTKPALRRGRLRVCPQCLSADVARRALRPDVAVYGRTAWLLASVRTCALHGVELVQVADDSDRDLVHDFSALVGPKTADMDGMSAKAKRRQTSGLETYLLARLDGAMTSPWLDSLEFGAAAKTCEMLGAVSLFGREAYLTRLTDADWHAAGGAGFGIASSGAESVRAFLDRLQADYARAIGAHAFYGRLYNWLARAVDPSLEPVRELMRRHAIATMPLGPSDVLFGRPVEKRRLHSLYSASREYGIFSKRLRAILASRGMLPPDHADKTDNLVHFDAEAAGELLAKVADSISLKEVETYLNAGRVHARLLADNGLIVPVVTGGAPGIGDHAFARADLDDFLARLTDGAVPVAEMTDKVCDIPKAAKLANCGAMEIVRLILDKKLAWTGRRTEVGGYLSVLVDIAEVKRLVRGVAEDVMSALEVERELKTTFAVVKALIAHGMLPARRILNPSTRHSMKAVSPADFAAFRAKYVSLSELAAVRGLNLRTVLVELRDRDVHPALDPEVYGARFYRRKDVGSA